MAGHNKWSQIKHKKAKEDSRKGKTFTKLIKEITVAARTGGGNPAINAHLRSLLEKSKNYNMPQENAQRAIKRGIGELPGTTYEEFIYEGYGPYNVAVIIETLSDNKNRTVADLRRIFSKHSGNLTENGTVNWMFGRMGVIRATGTDVTEDALLERLLDFDINDIRYDQPLFSIFCNAKAINQIKTIIVQTGLHIESADIEWVAQTTMKLDDKKGEKSLAFLSELHDHDDVKNVYTNLA